MADHDEVIGDSEEELEILGAVDVKTCRVNAVPVTVAVSSISDFTANTSVYDAISNETPHSRAKTQSKKPSDIDFIELTSEDDVGPTVKSKARNKDPQPPEQPRPRPRPRPRPIVKQARTTLYSDSLPPHPYPFARDPLLHNIQSPRPSTPPTSNRHGPELPIATSPGFLNRSSITSPLPPSDPPNPTMTTVYGGNEPCQKGLPPIATLQDAESDREKDRLPSSSGSFNTQRSGLKAKSKKRKRGVGDIQVNENEVDQLFSSSPCRPRAYTHINEHIHDEPRDVPPPTFFAGSSSSAGMPNNAPQIVDLTDIPPTMDVLPKTNFRSKDASSRPQKSKQQKRNVDPEFDLPVVLDEDDHDEDFDPCEGTSTKKKGKGKGKTTAKSKGKRKETAKNKGKETTRKKQLVGVVLNSREKDTNGKGKEKQDGQETYKSREFIEDSDEDPLRLVDGTVLEERPATVASSRSKDETIVSARPSSGSSSSLNPPASSSTTKSPMTSKEKAKPKGKKRKSIVESDEVRLDREQDDCIVVKRRKCTTTMVLHDEETEPHLTKMKTVPTHESRNRYNDGSRAIEDVADEGDTGTQIDHKVPSKLQEDTNVQRTGKENTIPTAMSGPISKPIFTPAKAPISRAVSINPDNSTPLYARYEVAPRRTSLPMSELIRRASSKPGSPFPLSGTFTPSVKGKGKKPETNVDSPAPSTPLSATMVYSPYLKSSRIALSRIAPLHPNRKTPPPPPPPPPPKKKSKKELEMEERWEEELVESVGGIEVWASMEESDRKEMRRAKRALESGGYED